MPSLRGLARTAKHRAFLGRRSAAQLVRGGVESFGPGDIEVRRRVRAGMSIPHLPTRRRVRGSVWAVAMVRNEEDVIERSVRHLLQQGVERVLVVDNGSQDATPAVLARLAAELPVVVGRDTEPAYFQATKMTHLARTAGRAGADWIVPFDADELWFAERGSLAEGLRACSTPIAVAVMHNAFPARDSPGPWVVDRLPARLQKVAFRWHPVAHLHHGNHAVTRPGQPVPALRIAHVPWRRFEQFRDKIAHGSRALAETGRGWQQPGGDHWRDLGRYDEAGLRAVWDDMLAGRPCEELEWTPRGELVEADPFEWGTWDPRGVLG